MPTNSRAKVVVFKAIKELFEDQSLSVSDDTEPLAVTRSYF